MNDLLKAVSTQILSQAIWAVLIAIGGVVLLWWRIRGRLTEPEKRILRMAFEGNDVIIKTQVFGIPQHVQAGRHRLWQASDPSIAENHIEGLNRLLRRRLAEHVKGEVFRLSTWGSKRARRVAPKWGKNPWEQS